MEMLVNVNLHTIKVRNFDMTYSVIPTYKIVEVAYKNWRGMQESGGRRIQRSFSIDMVSIKFCDQEMLEKFQKIDLINEYISRKLKRLLDYQSNSQASSDSPLRWTTDNQYRSFQKLYCCLFTQS